MIYIFFVCFILSSFSLSSAFFIFFLYFFFLVLAVIMEAKLIFRSIRRQSAKCVFSLSPLFSVSLFSQFSMLVHPILCILLSLSLSLGPVILFSTPFLPPFLSLISPSHHPFNFHAYSVLVAS